MNASKAPVNRAPLEAATSAETAPLERGVVRRPVRHLVVRLLEFVATVFAVFVRNGLT